jgi:hypothetical protein
MKKKFLLAISFIVFLTTISFKPAEDPDPGYIKAFGWGSVCVSEKGYPNLDKYDAAQFDFRDGKFYVKANTSFNMRAILPEGKTYGSLIDDFMTRKPYEQENFVKRIFWRIFVSHDAKGNKISYANWPPAPGDMLSEHNYMTSEKELCFSALYCMDDVPTWNSSGASWGDDKTHLVMLVGDWLSKAKPGYQIYIVHTVGYLIEHSGDKNKYVIDDPICTALVEVK